MAVFNRSMVLETACGMINHHTAFFFYQGLLHVFEVDDYTVNST